MPGSIQYDASLNFALHKKTYNTWDISCVNHNTIDCGLDDCISSSTSDADRDMYISLVNTAVIFLGVTDLTVHG